jgi:DNA-directed RNA polymerase specialized sigma subunit
MIKQRPAPVREQLLGMLRAHGREMTTAEIAERVGKSHEQVNSTLCKAQIYGFVSKADGYETRTVRQKAAAQNKWKLTERP